MVPENGRARPLVISGEVRKGLVENMTLLEAPHFREREQPVRAQKAFHAAVQGKGVAVGSPTGWKTRSVSKMAGGFLGSANMKRLALVVGPWKVIGVHFRMVAIQQVVTL